MAVMEPAKFFSDRQYATFPVLPSRSQPGGAAGVLRTTLAIVVICRCALPLSGIYAQHIVHTGFADPAPGDIPSVLWHGRDFFVHTAQPGNRK